jgi:hypothetical protein
MDLKFKRLDAEGAALFLTTMGLGFEVMSALNSSPWTAENFGADEARAKSCWKYTLQAAGINAAMGLGASILTETWWPLLGTSTVSLYMALTYRAAINRGIKNANNGWITQGGNSGGSVTAMPTKEQSGKNEQGSGLMSKWGQAA